jgi:tRNA (adenine57-N1/adenine58-N1)-methyltransferase
LERKAQVINQKDIPLILYHGNISNAKLIIEGGAGSGFLSCALASTIRPPGKVVTYEIREDFAKLARRNLETLDLGDVCNIKIADITKGIEEREADTVVVDIPNPQDCVAHAYKCLRPGGVFISYVPNMNQIEACVQAMEEAGFSNVSTIETLQRNIVVTDGGTRPDFSMLGHTGYITIGHKIG